MLTAFLTLLLLASPPPATSGEVVDGRDDRTPLPFGLTVADFYRTRK